jgi:hypothetical protein
MNRNLVRFEKRLFLIDLDAFLLILVYLDGMGALHSTETGV